MPTKTEREYYAAGYRDGRKDALRGRGELGRGAMADYATDALRKPKRKTSSWQKFVKANSNKKKFKYASGKLNLKKMGVAYRKTAVYKRNKKK